MERRSRSFSRGFTLLELLVVIAIIGILASIILASLFSVSGQAREKATIAQLHEIQTGVFLLESDTGKSVGGCPLGVTQASNNEMDIMTSARAGLYTAPTDLTAHGLCQWSAGDVAKWHGPYIRTPSDPWGNHYWYDTDYFPRQDGGGACPDPYPSGVAYTVVVSGGPNGVSGAVGAYDCDDIFVFLLNQ